MKPILILSGIPWGLGYGIPRLCLSQVFSQTFCLSQVLCGTIQISAVGFNEHRNMEMTKGPRLAFELLYVADTTVVHVHPSLYFEDPHYCPLEIQGLCVRVWARAFGCVHA